MKTKLNEQELYVKAILVGGVNLQFHIAIEESLELALSLLRLWRKRASMEDVASEVADVEIMCGQLRAMLGGDVVDRHKAHKLQRLAERIEDNRMVNLKGDKDAEWPTLKTSAS